MATGPFGGHIGFLAVEKTLTVDFWDFWYNASGSSKEHIPSEKPFVQNISYVKNFVGWTKFFYGRKPKRKELTVMRPRMFASIS